MTIGRTAFRRALFACAAITALIPASRAFAQQPVIIEIEAKPVATALTELAHKTGVNILFSPDAVRGLRSVAINSRVTPERAVRMLLAGTPLDVVEGPSGAIIVRKRPQAGFKPIAALAVAAPDRDAGLPPAEPAAAAEPIAETTAPAIEEIVVTAQKREESLQDTPISIAVLSADALKQRGLDTVTDLMSGAVPSLRVAPFVGRASSLTIGMRGIVPIDSTQISRDPSVGIYVDGVYLGRTQGLGGELFDVARIEVLRGPQGTLFGRNAVGGALSIVTKRPTGEFGLDLTAGVRNYNGANVEGHLNLPRIAGVSIKLDGVWTKRNGWVDNPLAGQSDWNDINRRGVRATALWEPADNFSLQYSFDKSRDESVGGYAQMVRLLPGAPPLAPIFSLEPNRVSRGRAGVPLEPSVGDVEGHSLHLTWDLSDNLSLRSISAYRELEQSQFDNAAGSFLAFRPNGAFGRYSLANVKQDQLSQELQLVGSSERLDYVLGGFYFDEDATDDAHTPVTARFNATGTGYTILPAPLGGPFPDRASEAHAESKALFGQATWTPPILDDRLHLTGGLRWTHDQKNGRLLAIRGVPSPLRFTFESKRLDPAATVAFDWSDDVNTYVRWGTAYRAGGANSRSAIFRTFNEEEVETWEAGLKADLFDRRARFNVAAYHTDFRDMQLDFSSPANPSATETVNTDRPATIKGVEVDLTVVPLTGLMLNANYAYTDWHLPPQLNPFSGQVQRVVIAFTPDHAASFAADYKYEGFSFGALSAHVDANYSGSYFTAGSNASKTRAYWLLNGRLTLGEVRVGNSGELAVSLWGKNLTNTQYEIFTFRLNSPGLTRAELVWFNEPRTYGVEVNVKF